mmetsp:Transcript_138283/g.311600  ORF Transcript_138283/g.311600 Transcript_138283/m.311600 type:complete len:205 (-) Transcript_138283:590-1204(-)
MLRRAGVLHPGDGRVVRGTPLFVAFLRLHKKLVVLGELPRLDTLAEARHVHVGEDKILHHLLDLSALLVPDRLQPLQGRIGPQEQRVVLAEIPGWNQLPEQLHILLFHRGLQHLSHSIVLVLVGGLPGNSCLLGALGLEGPTRQGAPQVLHVPPLLRPVQPGDQLVQLLPPRLSLFPRLAEHRNVVAERPDLHGFAQAGDGLYR